MATTLTRDESKVLSDIIAEELLEFGLSEACENKTAVAKEITPRVAKRFDSHPILEGEILFYPQSSLEKAIVAKIEGIEAECI